MFNTKSMTQFIVSMALFMDVLDSNILNTAIPIMSHAFHVNPIDMKIALISYLLSLAIFIPMSGWVADKYGTKNIFITAMGVFTLSSIFCGMSHTLLELVIARCFQGIGGAFMISLGRLIIARTFARHELVNAMNAVVIVVSVAVMVGPFVGGVIVDHLSWQWIFWVNIPAGIFAILFSSHYLKETAEKNPKPFDFLGFILFGGGLSLLSFSLSEMSAPQIDVHLIIALMIVSFFMLIVYCFHALRIQHPVIRVTLFKIRTFRVSVFGNLFARLGFGGMPFLLPLMQQLGFGFSAQLSGLLLLPIALGIIFSKLVAVHGLKRLGYRKFLLINTFLVGLLVWTFQSITSATPIYGIALLTFILGVFISAQFTGMSSLAFADLDPKDLSASTSITSTTQMLAQSFGVAVGAILLRFYSEKINHSLKLTTAIFHHAFFILGI
ncbi:MAG: multidrug transporter, partial [Gammaproteobacteria bacterium RIFCSPHIGHO2_12_FULL_38_11]